MLSLVNNFYRETIVAYRRFMKNGFRYLKRRISLKDHNNYIGKTLISLRRSRRMNQEALAFESSLDRTYISNLETNKQEPSLGTLRSLAKGLGLTYSEFSIEIEKDLENDEDIK
jgi:DNA-binding XRE family transcriptional regulator